MERTKPPDTFTDPQTWKGRIRFHKQKSILSTNTLADALRSAVLSFRFLTAINLDYSLSEERRIAGGNPAQILEGLLPHLLLSHNLPCVTSLAIINLQIEDLPEFSEDVDDDDGRSVLRRLEKLELMFDFRAQQGDDGETAPYHRLPALFQRLMNLSSLSVRFPRGAGHCPQKSCPTRTAPKASVSPWQSAGWRTSSSGWPFRR